METLKEIFEELTDDNLFFALQKVFYYTFRVTKSIIEKILKNRERWRKI